MASRTIGDRYELHDKIGSGGMGAVYRATDTRLLRDVAVKVVSTELSVGATRFFFQREARAIASLRHSNIVQVYDFSGADAAMLYLVMELIEGPTLDQAQRDWPRMPEAFIISIAHGVASALEHAHNKGVIHRDIKPGNIIVESSSGRVLLTDFGLAKAYDDPAKLGIIDPGRKTGLLGTPGFMSPEQVSRDRVGPASDIFALGSVLYLLATGQVPFVHPDLLELMRLIAEVAFTPISKARPHSSDGFVELVDSCLRAEPPRRTTATELKHSCERLLAELGARSPESCVIEFLGFDRTTISGPISDAFPEDDVADGETVTAEGETVTAERDAVTAVGRVADLEVTAMTSNIPANSDAIWPVAWDGRKKVAVGAAAVFSLVLAILFLALAGDSTSVTPIDADSLSGALDVGVQNPPPTVVPQPPPITPQPAPVVSQPGPQVEAWPPPRKPPAKRPRPRKAKATRPDDATLEVNVRPWGTIWLDGKEQGDAPLVRVLTVTPGKHTVVIKHPTLGRKKQVVIVKPGDREVIWFDLK